MFSDIKEKYTQPTTLMITCLFLGLPGGFYGWEEAITRISYSYAIDVHANTPSGQKCTLGCEDNGIK